jgi:hypothetical protein
VKPPVRVEPQVLTLWRDHDDALLDMPGISMGTRRPGPAGWTDAAATVAGLYHGGVRRAALSHPVDLTRNTDPAGLVQAMVLLRELTSWGIAVDWVAHFDDADMWRLLNHLYPPKAMIGHPDADAALVDWRQTFYLCKCVYRQGPGFIQVRDRRAGSLSRFTIDDPDYITAVGTLLDGAPVGAVPEPILTAFLDEGLAGIVGDLAWWLPYRVRRWPWPSLVV